MKENNIKFELIYLNDIKDIIFIHSNDTLLLFFKKISLYKQNIIYVDNNLKNILNKYLKEINNELNYIEKSIKKIFQKYKLKKSEYNSLLLRDKNEFLRTSGINDLFKNIKYKYLFVKNSNILDYDLKFLKVKKLLNINYNFISKEIISKNKNIYFFEYYEDLFTITNSIYYLKENEKKVFELINRTENKVININIIENNNNVIKLNLYKKVKYV